MKSHMNTEDTLGMLKENKHRYIYKKYVFFSFFTPSYIPRQTCMQAITPGDVNVMAHEMNQASSNDFFIWQNLVSVSAAANVFTYSQQYESSNTLPN